MERALSTKIDLNETWKLAWKPIGEAPDVPECASPIDAIVPGDVHVDLIRAGILPEPLVGVNAPKHEWVERAAFAYEREFVIDSDFDRAELVFEGLDCLAEVFVDGRRVGSSANAFVPHVFDVTELVEKGRTHHIRVDLETGVTWAKAQDRSPYECGDNPERIFLRKSQFSFKWDWAPRLVTCGMWRDASLRLYRRAAIRDVMLTSVFEGGAAVLTASVEAEAFEPGEYLLSLRVTLDSQTWEITKNVQLNQGVGSVELAARIDSVRRWFPAGFGDQPMYEVEVEIGAPDGSLDRRRTDYGFREVKIRQDETGEGEKTFVVNVNGTDVFCKGANWVPADSIPARVAREKYDTLISEALEANFNMFRIWGGGIYESDVFYELCDRRGVMIWHDFMFACAEYPEDRDEFLENVRDEAEKAVRRLRHHPCIALWCGNNENDWIYGRMVRGKNERLVDFHGRKIYHEVLPAICAELDPNRPYWPSSPYGGEDPNSEQMGDRHAWNVSILEPDLAARADIRNYRKDRGKFNSEYGVISYALPLTILDYTLDTKIDFSSKAYRVHDNSFNAGVAENESLTDWYLKIGFGSIPQDPATYIAQSLAYQAMGYREAISSFRIRKFDCAGSLFWMYSDCWGTLGWTIVDYYLRRKPSFYWVRKAYAPLAVFVRVEDGAARSFVVNDTLEDVPVTLALEVGDMSGTGRGVAEDLVAPANGVAAGPDIKCGKGYAFARIERDGKTLSDDLVLTHFPAEMEIPAVNVRAQTRKTENGVEVTVESDGFGHFVYLDLPDGAKPDDNYFNLLPTRPKVVTVEGVAPEQVRVGALNARCDGRGR